MDINLPSNSPLGSVPSGDTTPGSASSDSGISGVFAAVLADPNEAAPKKSASPDPNDLAETGPTSSAPATDTVQKVLIGETIFHVALREDGRCRLVSLDELQSKLLAKAKMKLIYDFCMADHIKKELFTQLEVTLLRDNGVFKTAGRLKRYAVRVESVHRIINMVSRRIGIDIDDSGYTEWKQYSFTMIPPNKPTFTSVSSIATETLPCETEQSSHIVTTAESVSKDVSLVSLPVTSQSGKRNVSEPLSEETCCLGLSSRQAADVDSDHVVHPNLTIELNKTMDRTKPNGFLLESTALIESQSVGISSMLDQKDHIAESEAARCHLDIDSQSVIPTEPNTEIVSPTIDGKPSDSSSREPLDNVIENDVKMTLPCPNDLILKDSEPVVETDESMEMKTETVLASNDVTMVSKDTFSYVKTDSGDKNTICPITDSVEVTLGKTCDEVESKSGEIDTDMLPKSNKWFSDSEVKTFEETSSRAVPNSTAVKTMDLCAHTETNTPVIPSTSNNTPPVELSVSMESEPVSPPSCQSVSARAFKWRGKKLHAFNREAGELISVAEFCQNLNELIANQNTSIAYDLMVKILDKKFLLSELDLTFDEIVFLENNDSHPADLLRRRAMIPLTGLDYAFALTARKATSMQTSETDRNKKAKKKKKKKRKVSSSSDTSDSSLSPSPSSQLSTGEIIKEPAQASSSSDHPAVMTTSSHAPCPTAHNPGTSPATCSGPNVPPESGCSDLVVPTPDSIQALSGDNSVSMHDVSVSEEKESGLISSQLVDMPNVLRTESSKMLSSQAAAAGVDSSTATPSFLVGQSQFGAEESASNLVQGTLQVCCGELEANMSLNRGCVATVSASRTPVTEIKNSDIACEPSGRVDSMVESDAVPNTNLPCQQATSFIPGGYSMSCADTPLQISGAMTASTDNYAQNIFQWNNPNLSQEMQPVVNFPGNCQIQEPVLNYAQPSAAMSYSCVPSASSVTINSPEPSVSDDSCTCARTRPLEYRYKDRWGFRKKQWEKLKVQFKRCPKKIRPGTGFVLPKTTRFFILKSCDGTFTVKVKKIRKRRSLKKTCQMEVPAEEPVVELDPPMETGEGLEFGMPQLMITDVHSLQPDNVPPVPVYPQSYQPQMAVSYEGLQAASLDQQPQMLYNPGVSADGMPFMVYSEQPMFIMCNPNVAPPSENVDTVYDNTVEGVPEVEKPKRKRGRPPKIKIKQEKL
ncbi:uncharacterized protein LOC135489706 [Lineus longissimus]|uniref:uncharacterized protein LOC135489706 n=1 Tax=Lineus longissimus TaxID=88925 RepID=UPI002B4E2D1F